MTHDEQYIHTDGHFPVILRFARQSDLPRLEWCGQYRHLRRVFQRTYREQRRGCRLMLLADYHGMPIGQVFIQLCRGNPMLADGQTRAYLYSFRVMDTFRNRGIGTQLLQRAEKIIQQHGFRVITLAVSKTNPSALRLYHRTNYQICAEDDGQWHYIDHTGAIRHVNDPCWILEKHIKDL